MTSRPSWNSATQLPIQEGEHLIDSPLLALLRQGRMALSLKVHRAEAIAEFALEGREACPDG